jgi:hypothetical protein
MDKSMLGARIELAPPLRGRDFKSSNTPIVAGNNSRSTGNSMHGYARPCAPSVTKSVTPPVRLKPLLFRECERLVGER